ncbi:uncharacterized protein [Diadema antillarum]|uniref:uncharacterized protein n=1 Tax=Diadema antillarum TaxID=105358 RepID=UPI003A884293
MMGWKSTLLILFLAALAVAVCAQDGRRDPDNRRGRGRPSDRPGGRGGPGDSQIEVNLEQRGGGRRDGGRRDEGRSRPGEQISNGQGRQGIEGGEGDEFGGQGGFRRRGGKPFFGQGERREGGRQVGPEGDMSPMPFGGGRRSDRVNETDGDEIYPGRHHGRHHSHHRHHHQHHHGRRNESEESEEGDNNGTSIFPFRFGRHGNRRHHHTKCNESEDYDGEGDNNDTRIENAPFGRPSRRRHHPCKRNRTEEENSISDRWDRRDQSGRDGGRRGEGGNGNPFQRPGKGGRHGNSGGRPFGRRGGRKPEGDAEDMSTTTEPTTQTGEREIYEFGTDLPEINEGFMP